MQEITRFLTLCREVITLPPGTRVGPIYDTANLVLCVTRATGRFQQSWESRLGIANRSNERPEHWTRVRALARRLGLWGKNEYSTLRPVADLGRELTEGRRRLHRKPAGVGAAVGDGGGQGASC